MLEITGIAGSGILCDMPNERPHPDQQATLCAWILTLPGWSPAWDKFLLSCVHLRPMEGQSKPPSIKLIGATHELILAALDPEQANDPQDIFNSAHFLTPLNIVEQFIVKNDKQAAKLTETIAVACVNGLLPIEPQGIAGAKEHWRKTIQQTAQHIDVVFHSEQSS